MAAVHRVEVDALGLPAGTYPAVDDTLAWHLDHYEGFLAWAEDGRPHDLARRALDVLRRDRPPEPAEGPCLVWGDARLSNLVYRDFEVAPSSTGRCPASATRCWTWAGGCSPTGRSPPGRAARACRASRRRRRPRRGGRRATGRSADALPYYELFGGLRFTVIMLRMGKLLADMGFVPPGFAHDNLVSQALGDLLDRA